MKIQCVERVVIPYFVRFVYEMNDVNGEQTVRRSSTETDKSRIESKIRDVVANRDTLVELETESLKRTLAEKEKEIDELKQKNVVLENEVKKKNRQLSRERSDYREKIINKKKELEKICTDVGYTLYRINYLFFDPYLVEPSVRLVACMVYVGKIYIENVWHSCFLCLRGQLQDVERRLRLLYGESTGVDDDMITLIQNGSLRLDNAHLSNPERLRGLHDFLSVNNETDAEVDEDNVRLFVKSEIYYFLKRACSLNWYRDLHETGQGGLVRDDSDFNVYDTDDIRCFPFQQYDVLRGTNLYFGTKYFFRARDALQQMVRFYNSYCSPDNLERRLELIDFVLDDENIEESEDEMRDVVAED